LSPGPTRSKEIQLFAQASLGLNGENHDGFSAALLETKIITTVYFNLQGFCKHLPWQSYKRQLLHRAACKAAREREFFVRSRLSSNPTEA
jgi:hypothetical protein